MYKVWTGAPYIYLGMNSILIYVGHELLGGFMPFSYMIYTYTHENLLICTTVGVLSWIIIAFYLYRIKFFVKI